MKFQYMLAPIEDMTSNAFRNICYKYGADLTFTELTRVESLAKNNKSTWSRIILKDETPTVIQLLGAKEIYFKKFLDMFKPTHNFKGFNLNLGCPSPDVVKLGQGCALVRRISKTRKLVQLFRDYNYPISIKMRLGLTKKDKENKIYLNLIDAVNPDFFIIHSRYGLQSYQEPADFSIYQECVKLGKPIIANGDIKTKEQIDSLKNINVKGVMIGRAAVLDPSIFNKFKGVSSPSISRIMEEYSKLTDKYEEPFRYQKNILRRINK